jgi:membrane-associated protein
MLDSVLEFVRNLFSAEGIRELITWGGIPILCLIVFVETGLLIGFFLPGDSLLVTAGLLASHPDIRLSVPVMVVALSVCAIVGDAVGFWIGSKAGPALFKREDSRFFKRKHLARAHAFYEKYGGKTIVLARFIPIVRTFAPTVAGAAGMNYRKFVLYNVIGGVGWVVTMVVGGHFFGEAIGPENVDRYLLPIIGAVIFLSILPGIIEIVRERRRMAREGAERARSAARE